MRENFPRPRPVLGRKNEGRGCELWASDFSPHGARSDTNFGIVPDSFVLAGVAAGHHVELVILLAEPDRSRDSNAVLAEGREGNIFLPADFRRKRHGDIVRREGWNVRSRVWSRAARPLRANKAGSLGSFAATWIA